MTMVRQASTNITLRQMEILAFLVRREHWLVGEVASALEVSSAAATKAIARLERKGLVTRAVDMMDRRFVNVRITRAGSDAVRHQVARSVQKMVP
jgi:DNA-binding MarR family transcriptional regulator